MSDGAQPPTSACGCCEGLAPLSPEQNDPGLPAISYRLATWATFLQRMLSQIQSPGSLAKPYPGPWVLSALTTRSADDPTIALLDAWAVVADVLTFYQERIANEGFLRTATERQSVLQLARAIGYELNPGVAASAYIAFTVEDVVGSAVAAPLPLGPKTPGAPAPASATFNAGIVTIPRGTPVQSVPAQGGLPQTFETAADLAARSAWNRMLPRSTRPADLALGSDSSLYLLGIRAGFPAGAPVVSLSPADVYLLNPETPPPTQPVAALPIQQLFLAGAITSLAPSDPLLLVGRNANGVTLAATFFVHDVEVQAARQATRVDLADQPAAILFSPAQFPAGAAPAQPVPFNIDSVDTYVLATSIGESALQALIQTSHWDPDSLAALVNDLPPAAVAAQGVFAFGVKAACFGHNAPLYLSLTKPSALRGDPYPNSWDPDPLTHLPVLDIWTDSQGNTYPDATIFLERTFPEILPGSWVVLEAPGVKPLPFQITTVVERSLADYGLTARSTGLVFSLPAGPKPALPVRTSTAHLQSGNLPLAELPVTDDIPAGAPSLMLNGMVLGLAPGQAVAINGIRADAPAVVANEVAIVQGIVHDGGFTTLELSTGFQYGYRRGTLTLCANVIAATHGATVAVPEILGSGDASQVGQKFTLKRSPLTYVSAATPSGASSTLEVRVNDLLWQEAPSLYGLGPTDRRYASRRSDDGTVSVTFGDGVSGARLPTGQNNVAATYRTGIGTAGNVAAGSLSILQSRPPGLRGTTNPLAAGGGAEPQDLSSARANAPLTVLTLDRIVSLEDYEDFAAAFAGVGKAQAIPFWNGETGFVHLTVAGIAGAAVDPASQLYGSLVAAIAQAHDPVQQFRVASYQPVSFSLTAVVIVDEPTYLPAKVLAAVQAALLAAFGFDRRSFAQPVTAAEVITAIQAVAGVIATELSQLYRDGDPGGPSQTEPEPVLIAQFARREGDAVAAAELLLINPRGVTVKAKPA